ncbi:MAG TPA: hypothetical protein PLY68_01990 [Myxococcota bacterium]|nr:hypothetical protein [Myxococcota bacterium]HNZ02547.1 hypothetical protein [Myxococcota bacterium]HOD06485.1 hypothetical protein [Myxococcota bacterium]HPB49913.1 hypothetical protein [Myxococcota bacterium]HQP94948.1 hypothetical protein [Myxococcota bacterium]
MSIPITGIMKELTRAIVAVTAIGMFAGTAYGQVAPVEQPETLPPDAMALPVTHDDFDVPVTPFVTFENHGYFRFRFNTLHNLDLGTTAPGGDDPCTPPTAVPSGATGALGNVSDTATSANIRFRWEPELRIGEFLTIGTTVDFLDNLVLGQNPWLGDAGFPMGWQTRTQSWASDGISGFNDSLRIKAAWAHLYLFGVVHVIAGRVPEHFGLGIVRSGGRDPDSDYGDYVDGIFLKAKVGITYVKAGLEIVGQGVSSDSPFGYFVYPSDYSTMDDTLRWTFGVDSTPVTGEDIRQRQARLEGGKPVVDWGMYNAITTQKLSSDRILASNTALADGDPDARDYDWDKYTTVPRGALFWTPSLWAKLEYRPRPGLRFRLEAELAMVYGSVDHMQSMVEDVDTSKDFLSFGGALEFDIDIGNNRVEFLAGAASGGNTLGYFGINDRHTLACPDNNCYSNANPEVYLTRDIHHFVFNRDYRVDSILFREVIGTVTNAFYFKPGYYRTFLDRDGWRLGGGVSLMASFACIKEGTPGRSMPLGVEPALKLNVSWRDIIEISADAAVLFPLSGLRYPGQDDPDPAAGLRVRALVHF